MRFLFAIPHYFDSDGVGYHGSTGPDPRQRQAALAGCIGALHGLFAGPAVVRLEATTGLVHPGEQAVLDGYGNIRISLVETD